MDLSKQARAVVTRSTSTSAHSTSIRLIGTATALQNVHAATNGACKWCGSFMARLSVHPKPADTARCTHPLRGTSSAGVMCAPNARSAGHVPHKEGPKAAKLADIQSGAQ